MKIMIVPFLGIVFFTVLAVKIATKLLAAILGLSSWQVLLIGSIVLYVFKDELAGKAR